MADDKTPSQIYKPTQAEMKRLTQSYDRFEKARDGRQYVDRYWESYEMQCEGYVSD